MSPFADLLQGKLGLRSRSATVDPSRGSLITDAVKRGEAVMTTNGAISTWGPAHATGRIPQDTYTVRHPQSAVDWSQPTNHPVRPEVFDSLFQDALELLREKDHVYVTDRTVGAESRYALPVRTFSDSPVVQLFASTMFRPVPRDISSSVFADRGFTLLVLPHDRVETEKYRGVLREAGGKIVDHAILMDFERRAGIVIGTSYLGAVKKHLFTVMNHLLPEHGVLPLHCAAVEDRRGATHLFLGLSGTGKTTLSSGPGLTMIGDDEHLWSSAGIANMEYGCYAKLINLSREKELHIYDAVMGDVANDEHCPIIENAMTYPDGTVDVDDGRLTENSRAAYPLSRLASVKPDARGGHPSTILFLTADARGVLPPVAKLPLRQAMLWFLMGYTSKLAGTETGVKEPQSTFSRFFGGVFMTRSSDDYLSLFQSLVSRHRADVYLVNTGWTGGPYGTGKRMDISLTRSLVDAALRGRLRDVQYREDPLFHLLIPRECPGVDPMLLDPRSTWKDPDAYDAQAKALAEEFAAHFHKTCKGQMRETLEGKCPGY